MPLGLLWLALLIVSWRAWKKSRKLAYALIGTVLFLGLAGNEQCGRALISLLEHGSGISQPEEPLEAVFILGGGTELDDNNSPEAGESGDRCVSAVRLWRHGYTKYLVTSGASDIHSSKPRNLATEGSILLQDLGIPVTSIICIDETCRNTREEVAAYKRLTAKMGWKKIGLLSSAYHLPRVASLAKKKQLHAILLRSDIQGRSVPFKIWDFIPNEKGIRLTQIACWEWLGRIN